ncbi:hypothetical protein JCM1840_006822 [Sporobolomyces johnsonii]
MDGSVQQDPRHQVPAPLLQLASSSPAAPKASIDQPFSPPPSPTACFSPSPSFARPPSPSPPPYDLPPTPPPRRVANRAPNDIVFDNPDYLELGPVPLGKGYFSGDMSDDEGATGGEEELMGRWERGG